MEGWWIGPAANGEQHFKVTILLLEVIEGFEIAIQIFALVIPRITRVMYILVRPNVRKDDLAGIRFQVCKCIEDVTFCTVSKFMNKQVA